MKATLNRIIMNTMAFPQNTCLWLSASYEQFHMSYQVRYCRRFITISSKFNSECHNNFIMKFIRFCTNCSAVSFGWFFSEMILAWWRHLATPIRSEFNLLVDWCRLCGSPMSLLDIFCVIQVLNISIYFIYIYIYMHLFMPIIHSV